MIIRGTKEEMEALAKECFPGCNKTTVSDRWWTACLKDFLAKLEKRRVDPDDAKKREKR